MKLVSFITSLLLIAAVMLLPASADSKVTYTGNSGEIIFSGDGEAPLTDLFDGFKDVMPGDVASQKITVKNNADNKVYVKIYLRSLGAEDDEFSRELLSKLNLRVTLDGVAETDIFDAPADETSTLSDWVYLGTLHSGGNINLKLTLTVPTELGNEYSSKLGALDWEFKVEEYPDGSSQTGDTFRYELLIFAAVAAAVTAVFIITRRKRSDGKDPKAI